MLTHTKSIYILVSRAPRDWGLTNGTTKNKLRTYNNKLRTTKIS